MMTPVFRTLRQSLSLLFTRRFGTFWFASLLSNIGTWAQQVAEPWLLVSIGASSFMIGLDSFAMNAPVILLTLVGGALADHADRRKVIALFQSIQMLCPLAIIGLLATGSINVWLIVAISVVVGITDGLSMPSFQSITPTIVPRDQIHRGLALNATQFNLSRILGPSIAGLLISGIGIMACFAVSALSYIPFIGVALWVLPKKTAVVDDLSPARDRPFAGMGDIVRDHKVLGALLTVFTTSLLCAPLVTFVPVLIKDAMHGDASHFSTAVASFGAGGLLGAAFLLGVPATVDRRILSSAFAVSHGVTLVLIAVDPSLSALALLLSFAGASMAVSNTSTNTHLQSTASPRLLGKVVSLYMFAMRSGMSLGALMTGVAVSLLGVQKALLLNGLLAIGLQLCIARMWMRSRTSAGG
ncbi:MAG: MFS transporter [Vicinamibacteria bacterium]